MSNSNTINTGGEFVRDEQKSIAEKEYGTEKSVLDHVESKEKYEIAENSINNTMTNSNIIYSLNAEGNDEMNDYNKLEQTSNINHFSINEIMGLKELLKIKHKLMEIVNEEGSNYNSITNINSINNTTFNDIQPQTIHVSQNVFKEFKEFTKQHNTTLKQAVSAALLHYMKSFKK